MQLNDLEVSIDVCRELLKIYNLMSNAKYLHNRYHVMPIDTYTEAQDMLSQLLARVKDE